MRNYSCEIELETASVRWFAHYSQWGFLPLLPSQQGFLCHNPIFLLKVVNRSLNLPVIAPKSYNFVILLTLSRQDDREILGRRAATLLNINYKQFAFNLN